MNMTWRCVVSFGAFLKKKEEKPVILWLEVHAFRDVCRLGGRGGLVVGSSASVMGRCGMIGGWGNGQVFCSVELSSLMVEELVVLASRN